MEPDPRFARRVAAIAAGKPRAAVSHKAPREPDAPQRRSEPRVPSYKFGRIGLPGGSEMRCILKDASASGARIAVEGAADLPETVILTIDQTGRRYRARVAWRRANEAGLSFCGEFVPGRSAAPKPLREGGIERTAEIEPITDISC